MILTPSFASKTKDLAFVSVLNWFATTFSLSLQCLSKHLPLIESDWEEKKEKKKKKKRKKAQKLVDPYMLHGRWANQTNFTSLLNSGHFRRGNE